jgi:hypothetical protein
LLEFKPLKDLDDEYWVIITGYDWYKVSNKGRIKRIKKDKLIKGTLDKDGYLKCGLYNKMGHKTVSFHKMVANEFITNKDKLPIINHKDGVKTNNCIENLEWCTYSYNSKHAYEVLKRPMPNKHFMLGKNNCKSLPVYQLSLTGEIINTFDSFREAYYATGTHYSQISKVVSGVYKTANKFKWKLVYNNSQTITSRLKKY